MAQAGDAVVAEPFRIVFDQFVGGSHSVVLRPSEPIPKLERFQRRLAAALASVGVVTRRTTRFSPHLTLAHRSRPGFVTAVDGVSWTVEDFVLIEGLVGWTEHVVHGRWRLAAPVTPIASPPSCQKAMA